MTTGILAFIFIAAVATTAYVLLQAVVGWWIGATVLRIGLGVGPAFARKQIGEIEYCLGALPLGGFTKFYGEQDADFEVEPTRLRLEDTSILGRMLLLLVGPLSNVLVGCLLMALPVQFGSPQVVASPQTIANIVPQEKLSPVSVPMLGFADTPSSFRGQISLVRETAVRFWQELRILRWNKQWGGPLSWFVTVGTAMTHSVSAWLTCVGLFVLVLGIANLAPIPTLNGGHLLMLSLELIGIHLRKKQVFAITMVGFLLVLTCSILALGLDVKWLISRLL